MNRGVNFYTIFVLMTAPMSLWADYTGKAMSNDEIRDIMIQGDNNDFEKGHCYKKTLVTPATVMAPSTPSVTTQSKKFSYNARQGFSFDMQTQDQQKTAPIKSEPVYQCQCPCPYSQNNKNEPCGESSAYFLYPEEYRPKCYREDIQEWEVTDFRSEHEIPSS